MRLLQSDRASEEVPAQRDRATKQPAPDLAAQVRTLCHRRGVLIEIGGHYSNVARFLPPLVLTRDLAMKGTEIFMDCVKEVEAARTLPGTVG